MRVVRFMRSLSSALFFSGASLTTTSLTTSLTNLCKFSHIFHLGGLSLTYTTGICPFIPHHQHLHTSTLTQRDSRIMSHSGAGGATTTPSRDNMTHLSLTGAAAIEQTASEEPPMLALPPELQKTIVAYVSTSDRVYPGRRT